MPSGRARSSAARASTLRRRAIHGASSCTASAASRSGARLGSVTVTVPSGSTLTRTRRARVERRILYAAVGTGDDPSSCGGRPHTLAGRRWRRAGGRIRSRSPRREAPLHRRNLLISALVAVAYAAGAQLAYSWFGAGLFPVFFPAAGVTLSALVLTRRASWPFVLAGAGVAEVAVDLAHDSDLLPAFGWAAANLTEAAIGASLLLWACRGRAPDLSRRGDLLAFLALPVALAPLAGGLIGFANAELLGDGAAWPEYTLRWWVGDGLGVLVVGGAVLAVARCGLGHVRERWMEATLLGAAAVAATVLVFHVDAVHWAYVPFVVMPWMALRLGTSAVAVVGALIAAVAAQEVSLAPSLWNEVDVTPSAASSTSRSRSRC